MRAKVQIPEPTQQVRYLIKIYQYLFFMPNPPTPHINTAQGLFIFKRYHIVLVRVIIAVMKHGQKWGGKGLYHSQFFIKRVRTGTGGRNPEAGADAEAMEGCCSLACSSCFASPAFLENPGPPAQGWHYPQWAGPSPINH